MRQSLSRGAAMAAAATGLLAAYGAPAFADSEAEAQAAGSPGVVSGNAIQVPISVPVNVCGNSINVIGLLNPAVGNTCLTNTEVADEDHDGPGKPGGGDPHNPHNPGNPPGYGHEEPGHNPPGHNPPGDNNDKPPAPGQENPPTDQEQPPAGDRSVPPAPVPHGGEGPQLAETGAAGTAAAAAAAAALIGAGALLYRRGRVAA
ncbi:chaplin family protein [Streptomyces sp. NPDC005012]|uniref:chaplin n=1 Tax=Streptomyces sp. NPDC005012 TaxID=3154558 RepID=UPI0033BA78B2